MLRGLARLLRRRSKGYTLVELAAVTAIAAGITAAVLPIAQQTINKAKEANVIEEAKQLAAAVMRFWSDTGSLPNDWDTDGSWGSDDYGKVKILYTGSGSSDELPDMDPNEWNISDGRSIKHYLLTNNPSTVDVTYTNWEGPYLGTAEEKYALDPWGHCYLINVQPADTFTSLADDPSQVSYAIFVISAGPNGKIETPRTQEVDLFTAGGDDIVVRIR